MNLFPEPILTTYGGHIQMPAAAERDAALEKVAENGKAWMDKAYAYFVREIHPLASFTGEWVRKWVSRDVGLPHHPGAWGALIRKLAKDGVIGHTGEWEPMRGPQSHARKTQVYRRVK